MAQNNNQIPNQKKGGNNMYTLEQTKQIIKYNPYIENLNEEDIQEILDSTDNTRKFKITSKLNTNNYQYDTEDYQYDTEDYSSPTTEYTITEIPNQKKGEK